MIDVYPTINNGTFTIDTRSLTLQHVKLKVIDVLGKSVYHQDLQAGQLNTVNLNVAKGKYFLKLEGEGYNGAGSIIIQ